MRLGRIIIIAGLLLALDACKHENPVYVTVNEEFDVVIDNTTESVKMVIEGGFNPHIRQVVSNADWLQVRYSGTIKLDEFKDPDTGFYWLSGGEYPQFELSYKTYDYLDEYDERDTDVIITTESGNTLTLHVTQGDRSLALDVENAVMLIPSNPGNRGSRWSCQQTPGAQRARPRRTEARRSRGPPACRGAWARRCRHRRCHTRRTDRSRRS